MSQGLTGSRNPKPLGNVKAALNLVKDRRRLQLGGEGVPEVAGRIGDLGVTGLPASLGSWLTTEPSHSPGLRGQRKYCSGKARGGRTNRPLPSKPQDSPTPHPFF